MKRFNAFGFKFRPLNLAPPLSRIAHAQRAKLGGARTPRFRFPCSLRRRPEGRSCRTIHTGRVVCVVFGVQRVQVGAVGSQRCQR